MPNIFILTSVCLVMLSGSTHAVIKQAIPEDPIITKVIMGHRGRHSFVLRVITGPLRRSQHNLRVVPHKDSDELPDYWMDGKPEQYPNAPISRGKNWYGTDGGFPSTEFYSLAVKVDGQPWKFPKRLWQDCYEASISTDPKNESYTNPTVRLSKDGKRITIDCSGSDAAGYYWVRWHLRKDGRATRDMHWADVEH